MVHEYKPKVTKRNLEDSGQSGRPNTKLASRGDKARRFLPAITLGKQNKERYTMRYVLGPRNKGLVGISVQRSGNNIGRMGGNLRRDALAFWRFERCITQHSSRRPKFSIPIRLRPEAAKHNSNPRRNNEGFIYYYKYPLFICLRSGI
ncbi:hypothetical protein HAX54_042639 [Datura stramonium]|uniref:Uncharacterized protein n=1 Tax=Datura stramonium TaxID=4076 RepID=A0ABS8RP28_DATST|nr:hypothetical protein [Datura stramonium]